MSVGQFSCALLADVQLSADAIWANAAKNKDYIGKVGALQAIRDNQTVRLSELEDPDKNKTVKLYWVQNCDDTTSECTDECTITGIEPEASCQSMTLDICRNSTFTIEEKGFRAIAPTFEEAVAISMLRKMKSLDEWLAKQMVSKLDAFKGVNAYSGGKGVVAGFETNVNPAYWNASLMSYIALVAEKNKMFSPYVLSGTNLFEAYWQTNMNGGNADGKGAQNMFQSLNFYFDVFNIDSQLTPDQSTFLIDRNAVAFVSKAFYNWNAGSPEAEKWGGPGSTVGMKYSVASKNLPGVMYDVTYKIRCASNKVYHDWNLQFNGGIFRNPLGCDLNNTGIIKLNCEA